MSTQKVQAVASAVPLPIAETAVVTVAPQAPNNQVNPAVIQSVEIHADIVITGLAAATTNTLKIRRGAGIAGADIMPTDAVMSVDAAATDRSASITLQETPANFNAANGIYTLTATSAGAAQTARVASISVMPVDFGV